MNHVFSRHVVRFSCLLFLWWVSYKVFVGVGFRMFSTYTTQRNKLRESGFFSLHAYGSGEFRMLSF